METVDLDQGGPLIRFKHASDSADRLDIYYCFQNAKKLLSLFEINSIICRKPQHCWGFRNINIGGLTNRLPRFFTLDLPPI